MEVKIIKDAISRSELAEMAKGQFGDMIKAVVDVEQGIMAVGGELHADCEAILVDREGSKREYSWGINIYTDRSGDDWIEFDSLINIKPQYGNRSRGVEDLATQSKIIEVVRKLVVH